MAIIWETVDRLGRLVALTEDGWQHIVARHGDLATRGDEIREVIATAEEVVRDRTFSRRLIHYRYSGVERTWLRVIVNYRPNEIYGWTGEVITAHFTNHRNRNEALIWPLRSQN